MEKLKNPFVLIGYHGPQYFCDRENELALLKSHVDNDRNVVLYSWRRMGKSALITRFLKEEEKAGNIDSLYVDIMATSSTDQAIKSIIDSVYDKYGKTEVGSFTKSFQQLLASLGASISFDSFSGAPSFSISQGSIKKSETSLQKIGEFLSSRPTKIVIAIDEFQQISSYENENAEAVFRQFMQAFPNIRFIFSGSQRQLMTQMFLEKNRPFYKSCQLISIEAIPLNLYRDFISLQFQTNKKSIPANLIDQIYDWSRGQTYSVQLLCNMLFEYDNITEEQLKQVQESIFKQEAPFYASYQKLLTKAQWNLLVAIAKEGVATKISSKKFIKKYDLGAASTVNSALKTLVQNEVIANDEKGYFVHEVIFGKWLESL